MRRPPMPCPDENLLAELARDRLPTAPRAEIEAHLHACEACSAVVAELARVFASSFTAGELAEPARELSASGLESTLGGDGAGDDTLLAIERPLPEGARLGRYVVLRVVGAGAMGIVYAAYDPELDRKVALKLLRRGADEGSIDPATSRSTRNKRLLREAQALARLAHPHAITVHDVGTFDGPSGSQVFLAMEFVEGGTLTTWLATTPPATTRSWREVLRVFQEAGEGLAAAHGAGLVHRDFKPDNVLLRADGRVVVTDFGLARTAERASDDEITGAHASASYGASASASALAETLTRTGMLVGTPAYMAPEQFDGKRCDAQSDQFAFCVALYEGLYGVRPFQGRTLGGLMSAIHAGRVSPGPRGREVPRWLRQAVLRGLKVDPRERHPDMHALLAALRPPRLGTWRGVAAVSLFGVTAGATAVALWGDAPVPDPVAYCDDVAGKLAGVWDEPARAELRAAFTRSGLGFADDAAARAIAILDERAAEWTRAQAEACRSDAEGREPAAVVDVRMTCLASARSTLEATIAALRTADADTVLRAVEVTQGLPGAETCLDASALGRGLAAIPEAEREAVAVVRRHLAEAATLRTLGKTADARTKAVATAAEAEPLAYGPLRAEVAIELALALQDAGELAPAEDAMHRALAAGVAHDHDDVVATAASALADAELERMGPSPVIERWVTLGLAALESLGGSRPHTQARLLATRGHAQRRAGDVDGAIATLTQVLELRERTWGPEHYAVAEPLGALGMAYASKGMHAEAVAAIERARTVLRAAYGDQHPNYASTLQILGTTHFLHGHYADALALYQEAHRLFLDGLGPRHPNVAVLAYNVGTTLAWMERYDEALPYVQQARDIEAEVHGARSMVASRSAYLLAELHLRAGSLAEAEAAARQGLEIVEERAPDDRRTRANHESQLGQVLALAGRGPEADALLTAALATQRQLAGEPSVEVAETAGRLAMVRLGQGRISEARALVDASVEQYEREDSDPHQHAEAWFRRARVLAAAGEHAAARAEAERAAKRYAELGDQPARRRAVEEWLAPP